METPWKKMLSGNPLNSVSLLKIPRKIFIQEKSTKVNFVHTKITEIDFSQGKVKIINSNCENSEKTLFKNWKIEKKSFFCKTLRTEYVDRKIMQQVSFENSPENQFHGEKFRGNYFFWFKKFHGNQFRRFQNDQIEFVNEGSGGLFYRNRLHENCLHQWWNKNQYHFTVGNARWTVFIQVQCKETGFFERKSTNFIHMQPSEVFVNDQKALKIDIIRKEPNSQSTLEKRSWKNLCW